MKKQIIFACFVLLAFVRIDAQCFFDGKIEHVQDGDTLKFFFVEFASSCHPYDSVSVEWFVYCNPVHQQKKPLKYTLPLGDTLYLSYQPWVAVRTRTTFHWIGYESIGSIAIPSNNSIFDTPSRPWGEISPIPSPNNGQFTLNMTSNGFSGNWRIIGGPGMVANGSFQGSGKEVEINMHPFNWNSTYEVIVNYYFPGTCLGLLEVRKKFILFR